MKNITLTKSRRKHVDQNGKRQIIVRVKVISLGIEHDFNVLKRNGLPLKLTDKQYQSLTSENLELINSHKDVIIEATTYLLENGGQVNLENIENRITEIRHLNFLGIVNSYQKKDTQLKNTEVVKILDEIDDDIDQVEDISDILNWEESELRKNEQRKKILETNKIRNTLSRTKHQYSLCDWDKNNIVLAIGYLFTFEKDNGNPLIPSIYRGILNNIYEYQLSVGASKSLMLYDHEYCRKFIKHIIKSGVIKSSLGSTPIELESGKYDYFFESEKRQIIAYTTLKDKIKAINSINSNLYKLKLVQQRIDNFKPEGFVTNTVFTSKGSNVDHSLSVNEVELLLQTTIEDERLDIVKDTFLILVFAGGLRGIENFDVLIDLESDSLDVFHGKVEKRCVIPIFDEMRIILEKHDFEFPNFAAIDNISNELKRLANYLGWTRKIKTVNTFVDRKKGDDYYFLEEIGELFDLTFARKTFVNYARRAYKMSDGDIIQCTGHASVDILQHYMGELSAEELRLRIKSKK